MTLNCGSTVVQATDGPTFNQDRTRTLYTSHTPLGCLTPLGNLRRSIGDHIMCLEASLKQPISYCYLNSRSPSSASSSAPVSVQYPPTCQEQRPRQAAHPSESTYCTCCATGPTLVHVAPGTSNPRGPTQKARCFDLVPGPSITFLFSPGYHGGGGGVTANTSSSSVAKVGLDGRVDGVRATRHLAQPKRVIGPMSDAAWV